MKVKLVLIYGSNGAGKSTIARYLATKNKGLHIQLDWYSSMHRGKLWHTRKNNKDKMNLLIGTLDAVIKKTSYNKIYIDGVLIYHFMFKMIEDWCKENNIDYRFVKLYGDSKELDLRVQKRSKTIKVDWNKKLPDIYNKLTYKNSFEIDTTNKKINQIIDDLILS